MGNTWKLILLAVAAGVVFWLWRQGHLLSLNRYIQETRDELRKCTWPGKEELKGSTVVVMIAILLLGGFTVGVDVVLLALFKIINHV